MTQETANTQTTATEKPGLLSVADIQNVAALIDLACSRGAFRANEMAAVGALYGKVTAFLQNLPGNQQAAPTEDKAAE